MAVLCLILPEACVMGSGPAAAVEGCEVEASSSSAYGGRAGIRGDESEVEEEDEVGAADVKDG